MITDPPRKRLPPSQRRTLIVEAAGRLFGEHGYAGTTLEQIASAAGVTKPILYRHFDSKRGLYLALLARHRDDLAGFIELIPGAGSSEDRLRPVLDVWLEYVETHSYSWQMLFRDTGGGPEVRAFRGEVHGQARGVLIGIIGSLSANPIPARELEPLAELLSMGMASLVLWWIEEGAVSREVLLDALVRAWAGVVAPAPPSAGR